MIVEWSKPATVLVDVIAWGVIHAGTGYLAHQLPDRCFARDSWLTRPRWFERSGRLWRTLRVARWKDRLPEAGALFAGGMSKRSLPGRSDDDLQRFALATRRAELAHWLAAAGGPLFIICNTWPVTIVMIVYGLAVNAPFIAIQRYNRSRVRRVLSRRSSRAILPSRVTDDPAALDAPRARNARDTTGRSMP